MDYSASLTKQIMTEHLADLAKSGLTEQTIKEAKIHSVLPSEIKQRLGWVPPVESILAFPYPGTNFERYKVFPPFKGEDGHKVKYLQPKGSDVHIYVPPAADLRRWQVEVPLHITEGEKKALRAAQEGFCTIGLGGIWNWKAPDGRLHPEISRLVYVGRRIVLVPDSDFVQNEDVRRAVRSLGAELEHLGAEVRVALLPQVLA